MESKTKNRQTRAQIAAMAARAFNGIALAEGEDAVLELKDGWFNASYCVWLADGREVVLKVAPPQGAEVMLYEKNLMTTEVAAMRLVRQHPAIPVPEIYFLDTAHDLCDSDYFFMEKVVGDSLEHVKEKLSPETKASIDWHIGEIIRAVNTFPGTYFGYDGNPDLRAATWKEAYLKIVEAALEDGIRKSAVYGYNLEEIRAVILKHASALDEITAPCLVHWDAWDPNFFVTEGRVVGIIDFERALWAEPLMEAQFRPLAFGAGVTDTMRGYGKTTFTFAEEERCWLYTLHLALVMNTECYYRNYDTDFVYNLSREWIGAAMTWLKAN
ncbi:MAG: aminoglycoside phosphotransferase family protein [Caldilineaceae bacterium]